MKKLSVVVENSEHQVSKKDKRFIIEKIMEIKNQLGMQIDILFV